MTNVDTANTLTLIGSILSMVLGTLYIVWGIVQVITLYYWVLGFSYWMGYLGYPWIIYGILSLIFGSLTLIIARKNLLEGDLKTAAIMCFVFGGITVGVIGGILTLVAGVLAIMTWNEQRSVAEVPPTPPPPPPPPPPQSQPTAAAVIYCSYCGAQLTPDAAFCLSCGKKVKK